MDKKLNDEVRAALIDYIELYHVNLRAASKEIGVDYTNLISFKNGSRNLGEYSLKKIRNYIKKAEAKQEQLKAIIRRVK